MRVLTLIMCCLMAFPAYAEEVFVPPITNDNIEVVPHTLEQPKIDELDHICMAHAIYFESRGESLKGMIAVANVVLNRVEDPRYPKTICNVVYQRNKRGCQFSWVCDPKSAIRNKDAWERSKTLAYAVLFLYNTESYVDYTYGATMFHSTSVSPRWANKKNRTTKIGDHLFYR